MKRTLSILSLALFVAGTARAAFTPIAIDPASYNHDVVIEASAPISLNGTVTATMDGGTNKTGNTWYERGYNPAAPTTGVPPAGSLVTNGTLNHIFLMPPDYHANNVIVIGRQNGGQTAVVQGGTLTLTTPAPFTGLSFLSAAGNGPIFVAYTIHYADSSTESGNFSSLDWFNGAVNVFNASGRVNVSGGGVANVGGSPAGACFGADISVGNSAVNITSIDLAYAGMGTLGNTNNVSGRAMVFAVSGALDNSTDFTNALAVTGFTYDGVVEADGPPTTGMGLPAGSTLTNNVTATMDGGTTKLNNVWYEQGYYAALPNTGIPAAGSTFSSAWLPASYTMPSTYVGNCAVVLASNVTSANIIPSAPAAYGGLSFLCATANGDTFVPCTVQFADGTSEANTIFIPDWFNRDLEWSYLSFGRVNPNNRTINNSPDQYIDPFTSPPLPFLFDYRGLGLPTVRLFDAVINVTNTASAITNISLLFTNGISTRVAAIFAVSGTSAATVPPVFGYRGTPTPGMPLNSAISGGVNVSATVTNQLKRWEGTNVVVLSVTNIAGTGISYQWKKAPRGGGLRDKFYSFDYSTFANVVNGGRISGATSSALVISNALVADSADYLVVASNAGGTVTSTVATVTILTTNQSLLVGVPFGDVLTPIAGDSTPVAESIDHVIDQVAQKWLSDGLQWGGACCGGPTPFTGPVGFVVTPVSGGSICTSMRFFAANDSQGRDPLDYTLEGSNDGTTWTRITGGALRGTLTLPNTRNGTGATPVDALNQSVVEVNFANATGWTSYRVSITNVIDRYRNQLMQIAEIQLLGTLVPNPPVWVRQPEPASTVFVGASPSFSVQASGYPLPKYQWWKNSGTIIPGATGSTYTFPNAQLVDSGTTFRCVASNTFASITSSPATLTVIAAPTESYPAAVLANNPIGYWRLNEADDAAGNNGAISHDYRGGHNGYYSNVVLQVNGYNPVSDPDKASQIGTLAVADSYVADIKDVSFVRATNAGSGGTFSVEAWVNGGNQTVPAGIVTKGYNGILNAGTGTGTEQFVLDVTGNPSTFRFLVRDSAGNGYVAQSSVTPFDALSLQATWRHLVGVCDQPSGKVYLYVDGVLAGSGTIPTGVGILDQPLPMTIGARKSGGATDFDNQWTGLVDDVALYNTALSSGQVLAHYYAAQRPPIISLQPTNTTTPDNVVVTFYSAAYGPGTLSYQWYLSDGVNPTTSVSGQTSQNLVFTTTPAANNNNYQLVVTNVYGAVTSAVAQLTVVSGAPSFFTDLPASETDYVGHIIRLRVSVGGTAPFTYQWKKDGLNVTDNYRIYGSQTNVLTILCAELADAGSYQVFVTGVGTTPSTLDVVAVTNTTSSAAPFTAAGTGWSMQGTTAPIMTDNRLELTSGLGGTARAAFMTVQQNIATFNASFVYQDVSGTGGADGVTFCIQNAAAGAAAVGAAGGGLGYGGITPSEALAINIYAPNTLGIGILQNGTVAPPFSPINPVLIGANTDPIQINVIYSGGVVTAKFTDLVTLATFTTNRTLDIPTIVGGSQAFVGFTGADGGVVSTQVISNFVMLPQPITLKGVRVGDSLVLSWSAAAAACLQSSPTITSPVWTDVTDTTRVVGTEVRVTVTPLTGNKFYRLIIYP